LVAALGVYVYLDFKQKKINNKSN